MKKQKHKMGYPYFRRNELAFFQIIEEGIITVIIVDDNEDFYKYSGLLQYIEGAPDEETVMGYSEIPEQDWDDVMEDIATVARVGSRPNIPPPPNP